MEIQIKTHIGADLQGSKEVIDRLVKENLNNKLDNYLNKFTKDAAEGIIEVSIDKNSRSLFDGKIQASLDGKIFRFEREEFKKLDDLINHLFDKFKIELSKM